MSSPATGTERSAAASIARVGAGYSLRQQRKNQYRHNKFKNLFHSIAPFEASENVSRLLEMMAAGGSRAGEALDFYQKLEVKSPLIDSFSAWALLDLGRNREAAETLLKAQAQGIECSGMLAAALRCLGQIRQAWRTVNVPINPGTHAVHRAFYHRERAFFLAHKGQFQQAEIELQAARDVALTNHNSRILIAGIEQIRANTLILRGKDTEALNAIDSGLEWASHLRRPQLLERKMIAELNLGRFENAWHTFNNLEPYGVGKNAPGAAPVNYARGKFLLHLELHENAVKAFLDVVTNINSQQQTLFYAHLQLVALHMKLDDRNTALEHLFRAEMLVVELETRDALNLMQKAFLVHLSTHKMREFTAQAFSSHGFPRESAGVWLECAEEYFALQDVQNGTRALSEAQKLCASHGVSIIASYSDNKSFTIDHLISLPSDHVFKNMLETIENSIQSLHQASQHFWEETTAPYIMRHLEQLSQQQRFNEVLETYENMARKPLDSHALASIAASKVGLNYKQAYKYAQIAHQYKSRDMRKAFSTLHDFYKQLNQSDDLFEKPRECINLRFLDNVLEIEFRIASDTQKVSIHKNMNEFDNLLFSSFLFDCNSFTYCFFVTSNLFIGKKRLDFINISISLLEKIQKHLKS